MKLLIWIKRWQCIREQRPIPAVFLHTRKTAGSTIVKIARGQYGSEPHQLISHGEFATKSAQDLEKISFVSGHFGYDFARPLIRQRYSFTFLRDSVERVLSLYYFCRSRTSDEFPIYRICRELSLEQFLRAGLEDPYLGSYVWNHQAWTLASGPIRVEDDPQRFLALPKERMLGKALRHLRHLCHVGFTETFEEDRDIVLKALNLPMLPARLVENATENRPQARDLPSAVRALTNRLTVLDRELYSIAWSRRWPQRPLPLS